jgi:hypothetical protein
MENYLLKERALVENEFRVRRHFFKLLICLCGCIALGGALARSEELSPWNLQELVDRSDLIVVASTSTICEFCTGSGPIADGIHPTPEYLDFCFPITISRVLKGPKDPFHALTISYTALVYGPKIEQPITKFPFKIKIDKNAPHRPTEGAPKPGVSYIFFLQNRKKREPGSYQGLGKEEIIYNNFDFTSGMIPVDPATLAQVEALGKAG